MILLKIVLVSAANIKNDRPIFAFTGHKYEE
jgi:hypothetical protein